MAHCRDARQLLSTSQGRKRPDLGIPVCYLRTETGHILEIERPRPIPLTRATWRGWLRQQTTPRGIAALLGILLVTIIPTLYFYAGILPRGPTRMRGPFNIAVADFGELGNPSGDTVRESEDGNWLADETYKLLDERRAEILSLVGDVELQHERIGLVRGATFADRQEAAASLAQRINADVLVYGYIDRSQLMPKFVPEFYISPRLTGAEESTGADAFGSAWPCSTTSRLMSATAPRWRRRSFPACRH